MISTGGLSPILAIGLIARNRDQFETSLRNEPVAKREIEAFKERIGSIGSVDELLKDGQVFGFVMKAFGLESEIFAKAMMKKIMTSDPLDKTSLVNKLSDSRYREINKVMGFDTDGTVARVDFGSAAWTDALVERYVDQRLIDGQMDANPSVGIALDFERKVPTLTSWYKVLADKSMGQFFRTAFGLPASVGQGDVDSQVRLFEKRMKIEELQDPAVQQKLVRQYAAIAGALDPGPRQAGILDLFSNTGGAWTPITINLEAISQFSASSYRRGL
ncbi:hypothetical protein GCM10011363_28530 [Marivita lacus]|uniref:DUF1217 domain-containing protein n=1 Tax=Marivita lacus TaxID=1323742 RepID=A0ABQ1KVW6_9RHOB|nr:DUF1217 domain-containing protein [Marivita lacus]GGC10160.1 hypothetical protein GCM10011363_28530 [Marivita lacus]